MALPNFEQSTRIVGRALGLTGSAWPEGFRRAVVDDLTDVIAFRREHLALPMAEADPAYLAWRYRFGREGRGLGDLWVFRVNGQLVGMVGTEDLVVRHPGGVARGIRTMDILVEKRLQGSGLGVWLNQALFDTSDFTLALGGNKLSAGTVRRLFRPLPPMQLWTMPIELGALMRRRLGDGLAASIATRVGNSMLTLKRGLSTPRRSGGLEIRALERFDDGFDLSPGPLAPGTARVERKGAYLNDRLFENPRARYRVTAAFRGGELTGYVAWRPVVGAGDPWLHIIDWRAAPAERDIALRTLFASLQPEAESAGCSSIMLSQQSLDESRSFASAGFIGPRPGRERIVGVHAGNPALLESLATARWNLTDLDDDNDGL